MGQGQQQAPQAWRGAEGRQGCCSARLVRWRSWRQGPRWASGTDRAVPSARRKWSSQPLGEGVGGPLRAGRGELRPIQRARITGSARRVTRLLRKVVSVKNIGDGDLGS